jgi:hypothetical protein
MQNSEVTPVTLITILLAASFLSELGPQSGGWMPLLGGIVLLVILFSYDREGTRTGWQSVAFGATAGLCAATAATRFLAPVISGVLGSYMAPRIVLWLLGSVIFSFVDTARMGRRVGAPAAGTGRGPSLSFSPTPAPAPSGPTFTETAMPPTVRRSAEPAPPPAPFTYSPEPALPPQPAPLSVAPPIPEPGDADRFQPAPHQAVPFETAPIQPPPLPQAIALPTGAGKPATIYLNLLDQGIACLRTVQAEHLGRDFYRIVESEPEGENWEFHPGQVVRCRKQKLSNGKGLVAFEEAPRAT